MESLTLPVSTFYEILDYLTHDDLIQACQRFPQALAFCQDMNFWQDRVHRRFEITTKPVDITWRELDALLDEDAIRPIPVTIIYPDGYERSIGDLWVHREESVNSVLDRLYEQLQRPVPVTIEAHMDGDDEPVVTGWDLKPSDVPLGAIKLDSHDYLWDSDFQLLIQVPISTGLADGISSLSSLEEFLPSASTFESAHTTLNEAENLVTQIHQLGAAAHPLLSSLTSGVKSIGSGIRSFLPSKKSVGSTGPGPIKPAEKI